MTQLHIYSPVAQNRHKFLGGTLGGVYRKVLRSAQKFAHSAQGRKLKTGIKRKILQAGSEIVQRVLSGEQPIDSLHNVSKRLKKTVPKSRLNSFKKKIFRTKTVKKKGGLVLYRLKKNKNKNKNKNKSKNKSKNKNQVLYRLKKKKTRRRKQSKKKKNKQTSKVSRRRRQRRRSSVGKPKKKKKITKTRKTNRFTRKRRLVGGRVKKNPFANTIFDS